MTERELSPSDGIAPGDEVKVRMLLGGGCLVAGLAILAMAQGAFTRGGIYLGIGLVCILLGVRMAQSVTEGAEAAGYTRWYTAGLGLALMAGGAAVTVPAREAETTNGQVVLFLAAGIVLWMGATCVIAAIVKA
ncbi:MAG: hypothetical protein ACRDYV_17440, partial [Acidimicrobiia bacterium]